MGENVRKKTKRIGVKGKPFLAGDIITNILTRLPAKNAAQSRLVCKGWRDLTLTRDFVDLHFRHNNLPMIMVSNRYETGGYLLLDKWWELSARKKLMIHKPHFYSGEIPLFSQAGLVVFVEYNSVKRYFVCNPMDHGQVTITLSNEIPSSEIYGVFFHPSLKEYCSLWRIQESKEPLNSSSHPKSTKYKMLTLGSNPSMKTIGNLFSYRVKRLRSQLLFIEKYLYWMLDPENEYKYSGRYDIMQFNIISEEFTVMPCPVSLEDTEVSYDNTFLLNVDGTLSFLLILPRKITIWRLEDHARQLWTTANYTFTIELYESYYGVPRPTAIVDGKLGLLSNRGGLIVCNLMHGTIYCRKTQYNYVDMVPSHQLSLASLTNCTSQISIDQNGEVARIVSEG